LKDLAEAAGMEAVKIKNGLLVRLEKGEKINSSLIKLARDESIGGAFIHGLGAVTNVELGIYHLNKKEYEKRLFSGEAELLNLTGNISWFEGNPAVHNHVTIGSPTFQAYGGHLFEAEVNVTVELYIQIFDKKIRRKFVPKIGLNLLSLCNVK
jgi:predicted DNA-binding protein with PD1-like motif